MSLIFTFFNDDSFGHGARIYPGKVRTEYHTPLAFRIKTGPNEFCLTDGRPSYFGQPVLLHGRFDGMGGSDRTSGKIQGYNTIHNLGLDGLFGRCYYFVDDYTGIKYRWKVNWWGNSWKLVDERNNNKIAVFTRRSTSSFSSRLMQGRLTVFQSGLPEHLLALILLTQKLVHNRLKTKELETSQSKKSTVAP